LDDDTLGLSTGNGNGFLDPGERVELTVTLLNYGDAMAPGVTASLSTNDPHTTVLNGYSNLGDIPPGTELSGADNFRVSVSKDAPNRHTIYLSLRLEDAKGHVWDESVELEVAQPDFAFHSFAINDAIGNGDGVPDRGETCSLILTLKNSGLRSAAGITATVTTSCADVVIVDGASAFTDIPVDSVGDNRGWPFIFHIMGSATEHIIPFQVHLTEGGGFCQADVTVNVLMGQRRVLLVADDGAYSNSGYYEQGLKAMGIPYRLWSVIDQGAIPLDKLMSFGDLIWFTGPEAGETLTEEDQEALSQFLDSGGHLILSGQMIGMNIGRTDFYSQYLRAKYVSFMTELHNLKGVEENPVTDGIYIHLATQGLNAQGWPGEIDPVPPAFGIFEYDQTTEEGPGRILSSGMGAVAVETDDYKVAYFSFGLEGIEPFESRYEVIEALFSWFRGSPIDVRAVLAFSDWSIDDDDQGASQGDGDGFANPGETIELKVSLVNTGLLAGENVVGALRTSDEFISIVDSTVSFGDIDPDSVVGSLDAFVLSISEGTPQGHQATFDLIMTDTPGNRWSDGFGLTVYLTSTVSGRITDVYDGRGIPGATLHWLGPINEITGGYEGEGWSAADDDGNYLLSLINGRYWIRGEAPGFLPSHWLNILFPPDTSGVDFALTSPRIECEPDSLTIQLNPGGTGQRNLEVSNVYSGVLQYAILQMEPSLLVQMGACFTVDSLRPFILHPDSMPKLPQGAVETDAPVPDPERWRLIYIDGDEPDNTFDLDRMYAQNDDRDLYFKITAHEPWSNPRTGLDLYIWIDADNNVQTGAFSWGLGAEYLLITGSGSYLLRWNPRREYFDFQSYLPYEKLPSNADSLEVGIHLADIGGPQRVNLVFVFSNIEKGRVDDVAPDGGFYIPYSLYNAEWLWVNPTFGQVAAGRTDEITLSFDATGLLPGEYNLNLVIENNQPDGGPVVIPVRLTVGQTTVEGTDPSILPTEYALAQNYPNPFNPYTDIRYQIPDGRSPLLTALKVYNILGQHVRTLVNEEQEAGYYTVTWDGRNDRGNEVSSGIYFYRMEAGDFRNTKRMLLLK
ncbi:MAG: FlgD immunoglobulin-like domain containing protein, partial [bacterium]